MGDESIAEVVASRWPGAKLRTSTPLAGDAGVRSYTRLALEGGSAPLTALAMLIPSDGSARQAEEGGQPRLREEIPFVNVQRFLERHELPAPEIYGVFEEKGILLLEDLGDLPLASAALAAAPEERQRLMMSAVELLARLSALAHVKAADCYAFDDSYDDQEIARELAVTASHGMGHARGTGILEKGTDPELERSLQRLGSRIAAQPRLFMHRDYHAWNLHVDPTGRLRIIDFQDATLGPALYDLASLLTDRDTDRFVDSALERLLLETWGKAMERQGLILHQNSEALEVDYFTAVAYRTLRVIGRFGVLALELGKPDYFERYGPRMAQQTIRALDALGDQELADLLFERSPIFS